MRATFSIDEKTDAALRRTATRLGESKSAIVRRAVLEFEAHCDRLTEGERQSKLGAIERLKALPTGSEAAVEKELSELREDRERRGLVR